MAKLQGSTATVSRSSGCRSGLQLGRYAFRFTSTVRSSEQHSNFYAGPVKRPPRLLGLQLLDCLAPVFEVSCHLFCIASAARKSILAESSTCIRLCQAVSRDVNNLFGHMPTVIVVGAGVCRFHDIGVISRAGLYLMTMCSAT